MKPTNAFVDALLIDHYLLPMAYAHWHNGTHDHRAVFDLFFRECPFGGEYAVFAGLSELLALVANYHWNDDQLAHVREYVLPGCDPRFLAWLKEADCSAMQVFAMKEGSVCFPRVPLIRVETPVAIGQLFETISCALVNFPTSITTLAARMRVAAGPKMKLFEFGMRRAQGPDGGVSASRYSRLGGFDGTSNLQAGKLFGIMTAGTMNHAMVMWSKCWRDLKSRTLVTATGETIDFVDRVLHYRRLLGYEHTHLGELVSFTMFAQAMPRNFLALVDTYDTLRSGIPNYLCVAAALVSCGYTPIGGRLDSGDLAWLSLESRQLMQRATDITGFPELVASRIVAENQIDERGIYAFHRQGHSIDTIGIGTNLVTCAADPALGGVYKLVEGDHVPIKLSNDLAKTTLPGRKDAHRLFDANGVAMADLIAPVGEVPQVGEPIMCHHVTDAFKKRRLRPSRVEPLLSLAWDGGRLINPLTPEDKESRDRVQREIAQLRPDHLRPAEENPTPYHVSITTSLFNQREQLLAEVAATLDAT